jgi:hypothetical protein
MPSRQDTAGLLANVWLLGATYIERARAVAERGTAEQVDRLHAVLSDVIVRQDAFLRAIVEADETFPRKLAAMTKAASSKLGASSDVADAAAAESLLAA